LTASKNANSTIQEGTRAEFMALGLAARRAKQGNSLVFTEILIEKE